MYLPSLILSRSREGLYIPQQDNRNVAEYHQTKYDCIFAKEVYLPSPDPVTIWEGSVQPQMDTPIVRRKINQSIDKLYQQTG